MAGDFEADKAGVVIGVSIHARVWRATQSSAEIVQPFLFQSTPAYGGRRTLPCGMVAHLVFQSTPAYGGRLRQLRRNVMMALFQSTPAYGGRRRGDTAAKAG